MPILIALDDGHGMNTPGKRTPYIESLGRSIKENEFNSAVVAYLDEELKRCGFNTLLVAPTDADTSLTDRTDLANSRNADAYISIHYNAFDGSFGGSDFDPRGNEIYVYPGYLNSEAGELATAIGKYLRQGTTQNWRGINEANFHVLRETDMPAILSENGFMDNEREALLMIDPNFQKEVAIEHAKGICEHFGVTYKEGNQMPERDINKVSDWAKEDWEEAVANGYFDGSRPGADLTREEAAIVVNKIRHNFLKLIKENENQIEELQKQLNELKSNQ